LAEADTRREARMMGYPRVILNEEGMREGMQIESAEIAVEDKIRLIDALSETGLKRIVVGSFVSPKYTPQMARIDEIVSGFHPKPGVTYTALLVNQRSVERAQQFSPPLTIERPFRTVNHLCDVFTRRNYNRSQDEEIAAWEPAVQRAKQAAASEGGIGVNAAWGSNFCGAFSEAQRMEFLNRQKALWDAAGIPVTSIFFGDPMSWTMPHVVEHQLQTIKATWPQITKFHLHLHNGRGMAVPAIYAALRALDERHELMLDTTIGGMGGCPYCGNGRVTNMAPTEDIVQMLEEMGIATGVDLYKLIEVVWMAEEVVGHKLWGHVSKAGPLPRGDKLYPIDMPFIETEEQAKHFLRGPSAYGDNPISPWSEPIRSAQRDAIDAELTAGSAAGD
jgi:hydroxymethylglutaryl-CoA lyase